MANCLVDGGVDDLDRLFKDQDELVLGNSPRQVLDSNYVEGFGLLTLSFKNNIYQSRLSAK